MTKSKYVFKPSTDYLKYWRVVRYYIRAKYKISTADLDILLFLYSEEYLKKKHGMSETSVAETYEGVVDKIKAIKRGMQAKAKADDHFDKAGDPKNANASKDLKKAVRYHNLLNKEEVVLEAKKPKSFKNIKKTLHKWLYRNIT